MTTRSINDQIRTIKMATEQASSSKEAAIAFLHDAGIIVKAVSKKSKGTNSTNNVKQESGWKVVRIVNGKQSPITGHKVMQTQSISSTGQFSTRSKATADAKVVARNTTSKK